MSWLPQSRRKQSLLLVTLLAGVACAVLGILYRAELGEALRLADARRVEVTDWLQRLPWEVWFLALVILPAIGFPLSLFYLTAGLMFGGPLGLYGVGMAWCGLALNMSLCYWLSQTFLSRWIRPLTSKRLWMQEGMSARRQREFIVLLRLSPLPYTLQNYVLSLGSIPFRRYLLYSWPLQALIGLGVIQLGEAVVRGQGGQLLFGVFLFFVLAVVLPRWWRARRKLPDAALQPDL